MKLKKILPIGFLTISLPLTMVVSCSNNNSMEQKVKNLVRDTNIVSIELDQEKLKETSGSETIKIEDIFTLNCSPFSIKESDKLQKWNNDLTDENKELYSIETRIKYVELPQIKNENNKIDELVVYVEVSGANSINVIKKTVDISNINNEIILNESNYFIPLENEILDNDAWKTIRDNLILLIKTKSIDINSDEEKLKNSFSFKVEDNENSTNGNGFNEFQNNLYCSFVQKESSGIYVNLYTNNSKIEESKENEITSKCIAYKIYIPFNEIISYKGGI